MIYLTTLLTFPLAGSLLVSLFSAILLSGSYGLYKSLTMGLGFQVSLDFLCCLFSLIVLVISASVVLYSLWYMASTPSPSKFLPILLLFVLSMLVLISSADLSCLVLGWDGLGMTSYFLVIYYDNPKSTSSGTITVISNRVGDAFMVMFMAMVLAHSSSSYIYFSTSLWAHPNCLNWVILAAAITKSAMYPYCVWLPEAMAAPTPVSTLVHSSTLVTAGVYLLIRYYSSLLPLTLLVLAVIASWTMLLITPTVIFSMDFKKLIALSTLSHLCFMMITLAMGCTGVCTLHLVTHALFKSTLFMSAGAYIHKFMGSQEIRSAGVSPHAWGSGSTMAISLLSLMGFPPLAGFISKEEIFLTAMSAEVSVSYLLILVLGGLLSVLYGFRLVTSVMFAGTKNSVDSFPTSPSVMGAGLALTLLSVFFGGLLVNTVGPITFGGPMIFSFYLSFKILLGVAITICVCGVWFSVYGSDHWAEFMLMGPLSQWGVPVSGSGAMVILDSQFDKGWGAYVGPEMIQKSISVGVSEIYSSSLKLYKQYLSLTGLGVLVALLVIW